MSFWVNGTGNTSDAANHWAATSGGAPGAGNLPTSVLDAHFDGLSNTSNAGYTVTVDVTFNCRDLMFDAKPGDGAGGTITLVGSGSINCYGSLKLLAGMDVGASGKYNGTLQFLAPSGIQTITPNEVLDFTFGSTVNLNGAATYKLMGDWTLNPSVFSLIATASFDPNGKKMTLDRPAGTIIGGAFSFYDLVFPGTNVANCINAFNNDIAVTHFLTISGSSPTMPVLVQAATAYVLSVGTPRTITCTNPPILTNCDFMDITAAGAGGTWVATSGNLGDCGGNSNITFAASVKQTATGTASFAWSTHGWTSRVPLPQDDVDVPNAFIAGRTVTMDMPRLGKNINFTGAGNSPILNTTVANTLYGSLNLTNAGVLSGTAALTFGARSSVTLTSAGHTFTQPVIENMPGGTLTLADAFITNGAFTVTNGTKNDAGFNTTMASFTSSNASTIIRTGLRAITGSGTVLSTAAGVTVTDSGTTKLTDATSAIKTFAGGGKTYNNIWLSGAGSGSFDFTGSNTFNEFRTDNGPKNIRLTASTTMTVASVNVPLYNPAAVKFVRTDPVLVYNQLSTPNSVTSAILGDIDIRVQVALNNWASPTITQCLIGKDDNNGSHRTYLFRVNSGQLNFIIYPTGTAVSGVGAISTVVHGFIAGSLHWVRVTRQVSSGDTKFYTCPTEDGVTWVQLGATVTVSVGSGFFDSVAQISIGQTQPCAGDVYRAQIYNGINGTLAVDFNPNDWVSGNTFTSSTTGEVWTRNGYALFSLEIKISSITNATHTLVKSGTGKLNFGNHANVSYSIASPANTFYAGSVIYGATNGGNNTNWVFNQAPYTINNIQTITLTSLPITTRLERLYLPSGTFLDVIVLDQYVGQL